MWYVFLGQSIRPKTGAKYIFSFSIDASASGIILLRYTMSVGPSKSLGLAKPILVNPGRSYHNVLFSVTDCDEKIPTMLRIDMGKQSGTTKISDLCQYQFDEVKLPNLLSKSWTVKVKGRSIMAAFQDIPES